jgi:site-specific DNA-methyltransferase (adenine-specific)
LTKRQKYDIVYIVKTKEEQDMENIQVMFSSQSNEWSTPTDFFEELNTEFNFTLDPCSTDENHKCNTYFTKKDNGLDKSWEGHRVYVNPPYR